MSEEDRLKLRLARLASSGLAGSGGREIRSVRGQGLLAGLLREVDETLLPRRLSIRNERGQVLRLEAANRRLLRVIDCDGGGAPAAVGTLYGAEIALEDADMLALLRSVLDGFVDGSESLSISADSVGRALGPSEIGVAAEALAETWSLSIGRDPRYEDSSEVLALFLDASAKNVLAWVRLGDTSDCDGDEELLGRLASFAEEDLVRIIGPGSFFEEKGTGPVFLGLSAEEEDGLPLAYARHGEESVVLFCAAGSLEAIARNWANLTAP